ncbi:putative AC9 transposase [Mycena venus]|uniref:Putative AC9 transposase n=1 Tax=Mycena venus TaxID=2733690 RepID=A0A8H7DEZ2_9AGAR|nr:putative AC9 transposase [Mycena venus]
MNKYYSATDMSNIYRIAMVLHPSLKLQYFKSQEYETYLAAGRGVDEIEVADSDTARMSSSTADASASDWFGLLDIDLPSGPSERNHLEQYLSEPLEPGVTEPLKW